MLGAGARMQPGDEQRVDLRLGNAGVLAPELRATDRFAQGAEIECRPQSRREDFRRVVGHDVNCRS